MSALSVSQLLCTRKQYFPVLLSPCHINDNACLEDAINHALPELLSENKTLGIESSDPLKVDEVEGDLTDIKFKLFSPITTGFKQCVVKNVNMSLDAMKLYFEMDCPRLETTGKYNISGRLIALPVQGHGDFRIIAGSYVIHVDCDMKTVVGDDEKAHLAIKSFKLKTEPKAPVSFDFKNLFNGQKEMGDVVLNFANQNWMEVSSLLQGPLWNANMKKLISNINKHLLTDPIDTIFIQS